MEFHIARKARDRYGFAGSLFSFSGNVILADIAACRTFAHRINQVRDVAKHPDQAVHAGQLFAMGLIDEASHVLLARYRQQIDPDVMTAALDWFGAQVGADNLDKMLLAFVEQFPGQSVLRGLETPTEWLAGTTESLPHREAALEELLLLWMANRNDAFKPFDELFEDRTLAEKTVYRQVTAQMPEYFASRPLIPLPGAKPVNLLDLLRAPALRSPRSLGDQLEIIRQMWKPLLGDSLERFLAMAGEILREEELAIWAQFNPPGSRRGPQQWPSLAGHSEVPAFGDPAHEYERFSADTAWMPGAVLIAKSTYVWLAQLSRKYSRHIGRLDQIPDEDLAQLAHNGINTLWLIGIWERSRASQTIKQLCGNREAVASAYSLFDYRIADDLGGEPAYITLRDRAYHHGIRLASDMVPNHMGIDSPWVVEHPEWFIARSDSPYPAYRFEGPDLSHDARVEIKIEDHYYEQSDAAVVFRRRDKASGETRYIYHGNDGTSFPWNDTAQLDYLNPAVREQVIQTILHVARLFPVIRFDAAMTLAKRHFHRLWFPGPGSSGAIPSRAEYGMNQADFDRAMPHEFWREVVDRVAAEVPGTLLLAEAFWLMEGYFVRTLGMHRVYNSAFMNMLRDEENAKYRSVIKNTIEFDPDIMKRYVNFMSNPDERTAIDQFGKGDKYFGVAVVMSTLPGLPMFGHGQIEGFTEKYGMEYRWPRYQEDPDPSLVERHQREIAPLLKRRWLFAESAHFLLYDFFHPNGSVNEDVFAYSNRNGTERALVVYHNRYADAHGTIDFSAAYADKGSGRLRQRRLAEGLGLSGDRAAIIAWRDSLTGLEYLRRAAHLYDSGLTLSLSAYRRHVFLDWRELHATAEKPWDRLAGWLDGRGVPSLDDELVNLELKPVHDALRWFLAPGLVHRFADAADRSRATGAERATRIDRLRSQFLKDAWTRAEGLLHAVQSTYAARLHQAGEPAPAHEPSDPASQMQALKQCLRSALHLSAVESLFPAPWTAAARRVLPSSSPQLVATEMWGPVLAWCVLTWLAESIASLQPQRTALDLFDRLRLRESFGHAFAALGFDGEEAWRVAARIKILLLASAGIGNESESVQESAAAEKLDSESRVLKGHDLSRAGKPERASGDLAPDGSQSLDAPAPSPSATRETMPASAQAQTVPGQPALPPILWLDPDVRWLCGVHEAEGHFYLIRERYEELLWWLLMPRLLCLAGESTHRCTAAVELSRFVANALHSAEAAAYRVDALLGPFAATENTPSSAPEPSSVEPTANSSVAQQDEPVGE